MQTKLILKHLDLLLVDDNQRIHAEIYSLFSSIFKTITLAHDAKTALKHYKNKNIDIVITDIEMPDINGLTFIEEIRSTNQNIPIVILSAHTDTDYLLRAANLQIDGYITKPINFKKFESTLARAVLRLEHRIKPANISSAITYHPLLKTLQVDDKETSLGNKECLLLELLIHNNHKVVSKNKIQDTVWPDEIMTESALKNLLGELRKKLKYNVIKNQPARGWILNTEN